LPARLLGPQTLSPRGLTCQAVRGPRGNIVHADLHAIETRLATSTAHHQHRVTPDTPCPWLSTMAIVESVDVTSAPNTVTQTQLGVSDRSAQLLIAWAVR
jgi:hypothetical protein